VPALRLDVIAETDVKEDGEPSGVRGDKDDDSVGADAGSAGGRDVEDELGLEDDSDMLRAIEESKREAERVAGAAAASQAPVAAPAPAPAAAGAGGDVYEDDAYDPEVMTLFEEQDEVNGPSKRRAVQAQEEVPEVDVDTVPVPVAAAAPVPPEPTIEVVEETEEQAAIRLAYEQECARITELRKQRLDGVTAGALGWLYKRRSKFARATYSCLKSLIDIMQTVPAVFDYLSKLPPIDPTTEDKYLDWMYVFMIHYVDMTVGGLSLAAQRSQSCVTVLRKLETLENSFDIPERRFVAEEVDLLLTRLSSSLLSSAHDQGIIVAAREYVSSDGVKHLCFKASSSVEFDAIITLILTVHKPPVNFYVPDLPFVRVLKAGSVVFMYDAPQLDPSNPAWGNYRFDWTFKHCSYGDNLEPQHAPPKLAPLVLPPVAAPGVAEAGTSMTDFRNQTAVTNLSIVPYTPDAEGFVGPLLPNGTVGVGPGVGEVNATVTNPVTPGKEWPCGVCTYLNPPSTSLCDMCGTRK